MNNSHYNNIRKHAVLTGDIVESSQVEGREQLSLKTALKHSFTLIEKLFRDKHLLPAFDVFRGDSFQGVIHDPLYALEAGILIRAGLRKEQPDNQSPDWDARIAIGIGEINYLPDRVSEGDGPAYRNSGPVLDQLKKDNKLEVQSPWDDVNNELNTECALLDAIIAKWTPPQAEAVVMLLEKKSRKEIARELGVSQTAVHYRVKGAGWFAVEKLIHRYHTILKEKLQEHS